VKSNSQRSEFAFEALEPRLLLSADGLTAATGMESMIERDVAVSQPDSAVVVAYAMEPSAAQTSDSGDDIFDVSGQTMEAAIEPSAPAEANASEASVEAASSTDSGASGTEPDAMYSVYDSGSDMTQQMVETLNASNAPPSEVDGGASVSSLSSTIGSDGTGDLQSQALSVLEGGEDYTPSIQADFGDAISGADGALADGFAAIYQALADLLENDPLFQNYVPGFLTTLQRGDDVVVVSPTLAQALSTPVDVYSSSKLDSGFGEGLSGTNSIDGSYTNSLADRFEFIAEEIPLFGAFFADMKAELALDAMDINGDGVVDGSEAISVLVLGQILDYASSTNYSDAEDLADNFGTEFTSDFEVPDYLTPFHLTVTFTATSSIHGDDVRVTLSNFTLTMFRYEQVDLGYLADELKIALDPGTPPDAGVPTRLIVAKKLHFDALTFGLSGGASGPVTSDDFFFASPSGIEVGVDMDGTVNNMEINVGFLGTKVTGGDGFELDMHATGVAIDPTNPAPLGFTSYPIIGASGTVTAPEAPSVFELENDAQFSLGIGTKSYSPFREITVTAAETDGFDEIGDLVSLIQTKVNTAFGSGLITVSNSGGKIAFTLVSTNPSVAGIQDELSAIDAVDIGIVFVEANAVSTHIGTDANPFSVPQFSFLISLNGALPVRVIVPGFDATFVDEPDPTADYYEVTVDDFIDAIEDALDAAGLGAITVQDTNNNDRIEFWTSGDRPSLEISKTIFFNTVEKITIDELSEYGAEIFVFTPDPDAAFEVDLDLTALPGIEKPDDSAYLPTGTINASLDPFDQTPGGTLPTYAIQAVVVDTIPETGDDVIKAKFDLQFDAGMLEMLDFNVVGPSEMLGIINQVAIWLERAVATQLFTAFDLPFAQASLAEILFFGDMVRDAFLIDDGDDGIAAPDASDDDVNDKQRLLRWVVFELGGDYQLVPMFTNAQQLEYRLAEIVNVILDERGFDIFGIVDDAIRDFVLELIDATYDVATKELTYRIDTDHSLEDPYKATPILQPSETDGVEVPMDFLLDLDPLGQFVTESMLLLSGEGRFSFTLGVKLGDAASPLDLESLLLTDLNDGRGVQVNTNLALSSLIDIEQIVGRLSSDAIFNLSISVGADTDTYSVKILRNAQTTVSHPDFGRPFTSDNSTFAHLLADINNALLRALVTDDGTNTGNLLVEAVAEWSGTGSRDTGRIVFRPTAAGAAITSMRVSASSGNSAYFELGLPPQSASTAYLIAPKSMAAPIPGQNIVFSVSVQRGGTLEAAKPVTVLQTPNEGVNESWTNNNSTLSDLVNDVNAALVAAGLGTDLVAARSGSTLVIYAINASVRGFSITAEASAVDELGLDVAAAGSQLAATGVDVNEVGNALSTGVLLRARDTISNPFGRLGVDLDFNINGIQVQLSASATATNSTILDLVRDLNGVLNGINDLKGKIIATHDGLNLVFKAIDPSVASITVANLSAGEAGQIGFQDGASASSALRIIANQLAPVSFGITAPTAFSVSVTDPVNGNLAWNATLSDQVTITNRNLFDLAADLNQAMNAGFIATYYPGDNNITANDNPLIAVVQGDRIVIGLKTTKGGSALVSVPTEAAEDVTGFNVTAPGNSTLATELGLVPTGAGNQSNNADLADFIIYFSDGKFARISLDSLVYAGAPDALKDFKLDDAYDIENLFTSILGQNLYNANGTLAGLVSAKLEIGIRSDGSGLVLNEKVFVAVPSNPDAFRVVAVNGSPAALQLGILASDTTQLDVGQYDASAAGSPDGQIQGARIATLDILDRVFLGNPVLDATIQLHTDGIASAEGNYGFVGIQLTSSADQLLYEANVSVPFITVGGRVNLDDLFSALNTISNLWDLVNLPLVTGGSQTDFDLGVKIWPESDIIDALFALDAGAKLNFELTSFGALQKYAGPGSAVENSVRLTPTDPNNPGDNLVVVTEIDFGTLENFETLRLDDVLDALDAFAAFLAEFAAFGFLAQDIPLLGTSINELLDVANRFSAAIQTVRLNPAGGLQALAQALRQGFGLPEFADDAERDAYFEARGIPDPTALIAFDLLDLNGTDDLMRFDLRIPVSFVQSRSVDLDLGEVEFLGGVTEVVDLQGGAGLSVLGYLDTHLSFGIDLATPSDVYLFDNATGLFGAIKAKADNLVFNAAIGPMGIFVRDGSAEISVEFGMDNGAFDPESDNYLLIGDVTDLVDGDGGAEFGPNFIGVITATLPVFFPDDSTYLGDIILDISGPNALVLQSPTFALPNWDDVLTLPDFSFIDLSQLNPFSSIPLLLDTLDFFLAGLQDILDGEVFGIQLPLLGDKLSAGADFIEDVRRSIIEPIRQFVEQAPEVAEELVTALLEALLGDGSEDVQVAGQSLKDFLGLENEFPGLGLLSDAIETFEDALNDEYIWRISLGDTYRPPVDVAFDLGFPALGLSMDAGLDIEITWNLAIGLGISRSNGAFILLRDHREEVGLEDTELLVTVDVSLPQGSNINGRLGFLQLIAEDRGTVFNATFGVDVINQNDTVTEKDEQLSFSELGFIDVDVHLSAAATVDLGLKVQFNEEILPDTISALLPKLRAGFLLEWSTGDITSDEFDFAASLKFVGFYDVQLDMGSFLSDFLGPIVNKIAEITKPLQPVIDVFTARLPLISDLAGRTVTLLDIAGMFGDVDTGMIYAIADIITLVNQIAGISSEAELLVPLGDFTLFDIDNPVSGFEDLAANLTLPTFNLGGSSDTSSFDFDDFISESGQQISDFATKLADTPGDAGAKSLSQSLVNKTAPGAGSFIFPLFDNPTLAFGLLMGRDVSLVEYDLPPFGVDFTYVQKFPIWGPLFARITGSVGLTIDLAFGYDTYGVRKFAQGSFSNPLDLLAGFYVNDTDQPGGVGTDVPELILRGELFAGAEINLGIASAGVEGGIILTINFDLYDPDSDGKIRIEELVGNFLYEFKYGGGPASAPLAIFDVFGDIALQLRAFIEFLFFEKTFEITPPITLIEFSIEFDREPILATERGDGSVVLNIGGNSAARLNGDTRDLGEEIWVKSVSSSEVLVWGSKFNVDESAAQSYHIGENKMIIAYGGDGNDIINLEGLGHGISFFVDAGAGDDTVVGGQEGGEIIGGLGNDTLTGGDGRDLITGGLGNDAIEGGGDDDWLFGDNGSVTDFVFHDPETNMDLDMRRFRALATIDDGDDQLNGGDGNDIVFGGGGYDLIFGGADDDLLIGDGGYFEGLVSDAGIPRSNGFVDISKIIARGYGANDRVYGGSGNDTALGGPGNDLLDGGSDDDVVLGGVGNDLVYGGAGADWLFGDENDDIIFGFRDPYGPANFGLDPDDLDNDIDPIDDGGDYIEGGEANDFIRGQGGDDRIHGNRGADIIFGDEGEDNIGAGFLNRPWIVAGPDVDLPYNSEAGGDIIFGGADGDIVNAGTGADIVFGDDGLVVFLFFPDTSDLLASTELGSRIRTDSGGDHKLIGDGDETVLIKASDLTRHDELGTTPDLYATEPLSTDGNDYIAGGDGNDIAFGGGGDDEIFGDFDPTQELFGPRPSGQDVLIGDGGRVELYGRRYQAIEAISDSLDGLDIISGNDGGDFIFGGGNEDTVFGFEDPAAGDNSPLDSVSENDVIFGDNGRIEFDPSDRFNRITRMFTTLAAADSGRSDVIFGQWGDDVIFGGLNSSSDELSGGLGNDIVIGDQGEVLFYAPGLGAGWEIFPDDDFPTFDPNFEGREFWEESFPLFLVRSYPDNVGGSDTVSGNQGEDILIGGTDGDLMYGDDPTGTSGGADDEDIMLGDNGEVWFNIDFEEPDFDEEGDPIGVPNTSIGRLTAKVAAMVYASAIDRIRTSDTDENTGGADFMSGSAGADVLFGGVNAGGVDQLFGDRESPNGASLALDRSDILVGDNGVVDFAFDGDSDRMTLDLIRSYEDALGGTDIISGDAGSDIGIGSTGGDVMFGDRAVPNATSLAADGSDTLIGDNADIFLLDAEGASGGDIKLVLDSAIFLIRTTDETYPAPNTGGVDTIGGNAGADVILGGVEGDYLYGDGVAVVFTDPDNDDWTVVSRTAVKSGADASDIILGDNGALEWLSTGRFNEVSGVDISFENPALWTQFQGGADDDLTTLDLITTEQKLNGGRDWIWGGDGNDALFGGTDSDTLFGDNGFGAMGGVGAEDSSGAGDGGDQIFGDHGRLYPQFSAMWNGVGDWRASLHSRNFFAIDIGQNDGAEGDRMWGQAGDDNMIGQQGDDRMWGGNNDDDMIGGHNVRGGWDELGVPGAIDADISDVLFNDMMDGDGGDDVMAGDNAIIWRRGDTNDPRFRSLTGTSIYTTDPDSITTNIGENVRPNPTGSDGRDVTLVDHDFTIQGDAQGRFGRDIMAGGAAADRMFGQLDDDLMQGDGSIDLAATAAFYHSWQVDAPGLPDDNNPGAPEVSDSYVELYFNVPEQLTDGHDYMEGNGGADLMFGGLGQDDMIGGSSELYGLDTWAKRPDGSDIMFGGAGIRTERNDFGASINGIAFASLDGATNVITELAAGHANDADYMMGDNANIYRIVSAVNGQFVTFNYDNYAGGVRIIVRAMEQLDYHLGGADYNGGTYNADGQAHVTGADLDNGAADFMHGEAGDDFMFGMTGSDLMFGDGQDDDLVGGYGNDWMSGGTGQDGMLGDDGLIYTSRNSTIGEPLNSIAGLLANDPSAKYSHGNVLDELISTPGDIQIAVINVTGALKKTADLVPFSYDPTWLGLDDEFPDDASFTPFADDLIFGGLGSDFLHGGSGDDGVSGAEALEAAYIPTFDLDGNLTGVLNLGYDAVGLTDGPWVFLGISTYGTNNPGDALAFNPVDLDGQHLNNRYRAGEFFLYDEYDPRRKIMLTPAGELYKNTGGTLGVDFFEFVLNFRESEGIVRPAGTVPKSTGQQAENYPQVNDDGKDAIFGDNGNDWLVGGTGRDDIYGGWGNDMLNADDKHSITDDGTKTGTFSDTHPTYEDRAYGGAGRDVLIGNTGGDRLIDWVGEYNSYLVPYAPFGQASVSRTLQPFLPEFLYALSAGDGADFTRYTDAVGGTPPAPTNNNPNPSRNGEPHGELGLVLQKDFAWQDQTGAPADPQAGNIPGGHRDVLRSAGFNDGTSDGFFADSGTWTVKSGVYTVAPVAKGSDALTVFYVDDFIPSYFEVLATLNAVKPTTGYKANAYIIFDYQSETDFKFAGIDVSNSKLVVGQRTEAGWTVVKQGSYPGSLKSGTNYNVFLSVNGSTITLIVDNKVTLTHTFAPRIGTDGVAHGLSHGMVGLGADNAKATIDNMIVQRLAPVMTFVRTVDFSSGVTNLFDAPASGTWNLSSGRYVGAASGTTAAVSLITVDPAPAALIDLSTILSTTGTGGLVFDYYNPTAFKFAAVDRVAGTVTLGHRTAKGWFTDAVYSNAAIKTSNDQSLAITIKGTTVSVKWNNSLVISFAFNALATDGATGLLSRTGTTSFNEVKFQTDDPGMPIAQAGVTTSGSSANEAINTLSAPALPAIEISTDALTVATPAFGSLSSFVTQGPVSGSIVSDLLGSSSSSMLVSGFSGTRGSMIPMVTSDFVSANDATTSIAAPLQKNASSATVKLAGDANQTWALASVTFDADALSTSTSREIPTESEQQSDDRADGGGEKSDGSDAAQTQPGETTVDSIFGEQMMPPTPNGAVEPRKADRARPDSDDGSEPGRPRPEEN
jgi:Ca2+-binding RTX toxin-like protein